MLSQKNHTCMLGMQMAHGLKGFDEVTPKSWNFYKQQCFAKRALCLFEVSNGRTSVRYETTSMCSGLSQMGCEATQFALKQYKDYMQGILASAKQVTTLPRSGLAYWAAKRPFTRVALKNQSFLAVSAEQIHIRLHPSHCLIVVKSKDKRNEL